MFIHPLRFKYQNEEDRDSRCEPADMHVFGSEKRGGGVAGLGTRPTEARGDWDFNVSPGAPRVVGFESPVSSAIPTLAKETEWKVCRRFFKFEYV